MADDVIAELEAALGSAYSIDREMQGGMSRVFVATDHALGRQVAVKVLSPELSAGVSQERFRREILVVARLQHPHIVPVLSAGNAGGRPFYTMPFIEGESLRERLRREQRLSVAEAVQIARDVAGALEYAHASGIVHRDIKPENIMLSRGHALVTDFGIARALTTETGETITHVTAAIGTPAYMSPEQIAGDAHVDGRADVYALGAVLFEMLTGERPFTGGTAQAMMVRRLTEAAPRAIERRADVPAAIDAAIARALERNPEDRFESAAVFSSTLLDQTTTTFVEPPPRRPERSIAVLPFTSLSPDPDNAFFADGLTEEIITDLSRVHDLRVISRNSSVRYKESAKSSGAIGRELNVRYLLQGSVRRAGASLRVTAHLVDTTTDTQRWAERFTGSVSEVFEIEERIAREIVQALEVRLSPDEDRRLAVRTIQDVQAFEWYLRARQLNLQFSDTALNQGLDLLERAMAIEGERAPLLALKGSLLWNLHNIAARGLEALMEAAECIDRALAIDPDLADALVAKALLEIHAPTADSGYVLRLLHRACVSERHADAHLWLSVMLSQTGRPELALKYGRRAAELDPLTPMVTGARAVPLCFMGRFAEGLGPVEAAVEREPHDVAARYYLGVFSATGGRFEFARQHFDRIDPEGAAVWGLLGAAYARSLAGDRAGARQAAENPAVVEIAQVDDQFAWHLAQVLAHAGHHDAAIAWLRRAVERGFAAAHFVNQFDEMLAPLRGHAEWNDLLVFMERRAAEIAAASGFGD
jgi:eukaryotic-like serine/threonine-protein kinase